MMAVKQAEETEEKALRKAQHGSRLRVERNDVQKGGPWHKADADARRRKQKFCLELRW